MWGNNNRPSNEEDWKVKKHNRTKSAVVEGFKDGTVVFAKKIETNLISKSPFYRGVKNENFVNPNLISQVFGNEAQQYSNIRNYKNCKKKIIENLKTESNYSPILTINNSSAILRTEVNYDADVSRPRGRWNNNVDYEEFGNIRDRQIKLNSLRKEQITLKIRDREAKSQLAARSVLISANSKKEDFINKTANQNSPFLEKREDPLKAKVMEKYNRTQNTKSNSIEVKKRDSYYDKSVERTQSNLTLFDQKEKLMMKEYEENLLRKLNKRYDWESKEKQLQNQKVKDEYFDPNRIITMMRSRKTEMEKNSKLNDEKLQVKKDILEKERILNEEKQREMQKKQQMYEDLQNQIIRNKLKLDIEKRQSNLEEAKEVPIVSNRICNCSFYHSCNSCKRTMPKYRKI